METASQDNRKRALDALERRFAVAKAELLHQQRKKEAGPNKESAKEVDHFPRNLPDSQGAKSSSSSTRKDNYVKRRRGFVASRERALRDHSKRSKIHMSMKKHKQCGSFDLSQDICRFQLFVPMHDMWKKYMIELLKSCGKNQLAQSLLCADLHGAIIQVADCKVTSFSGANGIMIIETAKTFGIVTRDDKFRVVPKKGSIFVFQVDCWKISLHGEKLIGRDMSL